MRVSRQLLARLAAASRRALFGAAGTAQGRAVRFGIRPHVIVRETNREAWDRAGRLISRLDRGVGLVRGGPGTAGVGSAETVATRLREYHALGFETFIFSGYPHLEEVCRVGELLLPRLAPPHDGATVTGVPSVAGEIVANDLVPGALALAS